MAEQIELRDPRVQLLKEFLRRQSLGCHDDDGLAVGMHSNIRARGSTGNTARVPL
jgi:hypothetical protein